jgi:hypothetical protein
MGRNNLRELPAAFFVACNRLQQLRLNHNQLVTLPAEVLALPDLRDLVTVGNSKFRMPPRPSVANLSVHQMDSKTSEYYGVDFSAVSVAVSSNRPDTVAVLLARTNPHAEVASFSAPLPGAKKKSPKTEPSSHTGLMDTVRVNLQTICSRFRFISSP